MKRSVWRSKRGVHTPGLKSSSHGVTGGSRSFTTSIREGTDFLDASLPLRCRPYCLLSMFMVTIISFYILSVSLSLSVCVCLFVCVSLYGCFLSCVLKIVVDTLKDVYAAHAKVVSEDQQRQLLDVSEPFSSRLSLSSSSPPFLFHIHPSSVSPPFPLATSSPADVNRHPAFPSQSSFSPFLPRDIREFSSPPPLLSQHHTGQHHHLLSSSSFSSSSSSSSLLIHHSRDSAVKQWDETLVIAIDGALMLLLSCGAALETESNQQKDVFSSAVKLRRKKKKKNEKEDDEQEEKKTTKRKSDERDSMSRFKPCRDGKRTIKKLNEKREREGVQGKGEERRLLLDSSSSSRLCSYRRMGGVVSILSSAYEILKITECLLLSSHYTPEILLTAAKTLTDILQFPRYLVRRSNSTFFVSLSLRELSSR